jgi:hypothetical protein
MRYLQGFLLLGAIILIVIIIARAYGGRGGRGESFVSPEAKEVHSRASEVFAAEGGRPTYSRYKRSVPNSDPVQFSDVSKLHKAGNLTPVAVQGIL